MTIKVFAMICDKGLHLDYLALKPEVSFLNNRYRVMWVEHVTAQKLGNARYGLDITSQKHHMALNKLG